MGFESSEILPQGAEWKCADNQEEIDYPWESNLKTKPGWSSLNAMQDYLRCLPLKTTLVSKPRPTLFCPCHSTQKRSLTPQHPPPQLASSPADALLLNSEG